MTSKIVVNNIEADTGVSTVTFNSNIQGNLIGNVSASGVSTFSNIRVTGGTISGVSTAGITTAYITQLAGVGAGTSVQVASGSKLIGLSSGSIIYPGALLQVKAVSQDTQINTTSTMNYTSSLPTITQGVQLLSISFTPVSSSSILVFHFNTYAYSSLVHNAIYALFEDSTCIAAIAPRHTYTNEAQQAQTILMHKVNSSTTTKTYSVRAGCQPANGATLYVNTYPAYSGVPQTSLVITEVSQ